MDIKSAEEVIACVRTIVGDDGDGGGDDVEVSHNDRMMRVNELLRLCVAMERFSWTLRTTESSQIALTLFTSDQCRSHFTVLLQRYLNPLYPIADAHTLVLGILINLLINTSPALRTYLTFECDIVSRMIPFLAMQAHTRSHSTSFNPNNGKRAANVLWNLADGAPAEVKEAIATNDEVISLLLHPTDFALAKEYRHAIATLLFGDGCEVAAAAIKKKGVVEVVKRFLRSSPLASVDRAANYILCNILEEEDDVDVVDFPAYLTRLDRVSAMDIPDAIIEDMISCFERVAKDNDLYCVIREYDEIVPIIAMLSPLSKMARNRTTMAALMKRHTRIAQSLVALLSHPKLSVRDKILAVKTLTVFLKQKEFESYVVNEMGRDDLVSACLVRESGVDTLQLLVRRRAIHPALPPHIIRLISCYSFLVIK